MKDEKINPEFDIICPCCRTRLIIDSENGGIIRTIEPVREKEGINELVGKYKKKQSVMGDAFSQAFKKEQERKKLIEKKFIHAKDHIEELEDPDSPFGKE